MNFIGIDLHTDRFTCCYRTERSSVKDPSKDRVLKTFELTTEGLTEFYATLTADTYALVEATITTFSFVRLFKDKVKEVIIADIIDIGRFRNSKASMIKVKQFFSPSHYLTVKARKGGTSYSKTAAFSIAQ